MRIRKLLFSIILLFFYGCPEVDKEEDVPPTAVQLYPIVYQNGSFIITWSQSPDGDFSFYNLFESMNADMSSGTLIYETTGIEDTSHIATSVGENERRYYQVVVVDHSSLEATSSATVGSSYPRIVFVSNRDGNSEIHTMDIGGYNQMQLTNIEGGNYSPQYSPDGSQVAFYGIQPVYVDQVYGGGSGSTHVQQ